MTAAQAAEEKKIENEAVVGKAISDEAR